MDIKDAHKVIENLQTRPYICSENTIELDNGYVIVKKSYFKECQEARERQIPKKPNITTGQNDTDKLACCPTCDSNVDWTYEGFWRKGKRKYCHECGQAIDWSETV